MMSDKYTWFVRGFCQTPGEEVISEQFVFLDDAVRYASKLHADGYAVDLYEARLIALSFGDEVVK